MSAIVVLTLFMAWATVEVAAKYSISSTYYPYSSSQAYTWDKAYPQSCECVEGNVQTRLCDIYKCTCTCDITAGVCDYNCCCDPDCSLDQRSRFTALDVCAFEGAQDDNIQYCYSSREMYAVNPRDPMGGQSTAQQAVGDALCVVKKNYNFKGEFFTNTGMESNTIFDSPEGTAAYSYMGEVPTTLPADNYYDQNDTIAAFISIDDGTATTVGSLASNGPGFLQVPLPDFTGLCNDLNYPTFENNIELTSCTRPLPQNSAAFIAQCNSSFSIQNYVTNLYIAKYPTTNAAGGIQSMSYVVNVRVKSIRYLDATTGIVTNITAEWVGQDCRTTPINISNSGDIADSTCLFSSTANQEAMIATSDLFCRGFVRSVFYEISHTDEDKFQITSVSADVVLSDISFSFPSSESNAGVVQSFGALFYSDDPSAATEDNGNEVKRIRSGNPGYLTGFPLLYGYQALRSTTVNELVSGLQVPTSLSYFNINATGTFGRGTCPTAISASEGTYGAVSPIGKKGVSFGYDVSTGCTMELTRGDLLNMCCAASDTCPSLDNGADYYSKYLDRSGKPYFFFNNSGVVGIYGNADPLDRTQWLTMNYPSFKSSSQTWDDSASTCYGVTTGMNIEFLVKFTGERINPQSKIASARVTAVTSDLVMKLPPNDDITTQAFPFSVSVTFIFQEYLEYEEYHPPAPPVLFKVPYDVFYPFQGILGAAPAGHRQRMDTAVLMSGALMGAISGILFFFC